VNRSKRNGGKMEENKMTELIRECKELIEVLYCPVRKMSLSDLQKKLEHLISLSKENYPSLCEELENAITKFQDNGNFYLGCIFCVLSLMEREEEGINRRKIFISHSSKDKNIVEDFTNKVLRLGVGISHEDIFCTSIEGMDIRTGEDIRKHIKENLKYCDYVFLMISQNYNESVVCLNEMGAAWALEKQVKPFLLPRTTIEDLGWIYNVNIASKIEERATLNALHDELCERYSFAKNTTNWGKEVESFLQCLKTSQEIK
jgi:hypothetical protein